MSDQPLSLEQQFNLRSFQTHVDNMSREQAQDFLVKLYEQMIIRDTMYKNMLKKQWLSQMTEINIDLREFQ